MSAHIDELEFERRLRKEFLSEATDLLEQTESAFITLEQTPKDTKLVDQIFRLAHTLKGSGATVGFKDLAAFCHHFENLIGSVREGSLAIDSAVIDTLLLCNDTLKDAVDTLKTDPDSIIDTARATAALASHRPTSKTKTPPPEKNVSPIKAPVPSPSRPPAEKSALPKVLCVDDEPEILEILCDFVKDAGAIPVTAANGLEALAMTQEHSFSLVMTDVRMPRMSGITFISELRKINGNLPVIFISGQANKEDMTKLISLGAFEFISKPFDEVSTMLKIRNALSHGNLQELILQAVTLNFKAYMGCQQLASGVASKANVDDLLKISSELENNLESLRAPTGQMVADRRKAA